MKRKRSMQVFKLPWSIPTDIGCVSISAFASLVGVLADVASSAIG